jgi:hypothetical protein
MLNGDEWTQSSTLPVISIGNEKLVIPQDQTIAGIGYFKIKKDKTQVNTSLATLLFKIQIIMFYGRRLLAIF